MIGDDGIRILEVDDGVNDEEACYLACKKLEAEGFWEDVKRRYGIKSSVDSSKNPGKSSSERGGHSSIPSGVQAFLNRTLDYANKLVKNPLSVIDDVAELPARAVDAIVKKNR